MILILLPWLVRLFSSLLLTVLLGTYYDMHKEHSMMLGLGFLYRVLNTIRYRKRRNLISDHIGTRHGFITSVLHEEPRDSVYQDGEHWERQDEELRFTGDDQRVNEAWPWSAKNKHQLSYNHTWK